MVRDYEEETKQISNKLDTVKSELAENQRRLLRKQLQKQGKVLLKCQYNSRNVLGCLRNYQCENCVANYTPHNNHAQLETTNHA